jgi:uncharacterized RDD family membrane protein YckC
VAKAAPYLASPLKRIIAGVIDVVLYVICLMLVMAALSDIQISPGSWMRGFALIAGVTYTLYHVAFFWFFSGATPGQRAWDMSVVRASDGSRISAVRGVVRAGFRPLLLFLLGSSVDLLLAPSVRVEAVIAAPLFLEAGMMFTLPSRQTLADIVAMTVVVNVPPPQPHRAPAAPMYSPSDAEFGVPPRPPR